MPVTAKLSRKFYEALGDDVTNELVDWLNQVDMAYRSELRELNEINFARFDARLEHRIVESEARLRQDILKQGTDLSTRMEAIRADLIKWMFLFCIGSALTVIGFLKF